MADSFTQFSEVLRDLTQEQSDWLKAELHGPPFPDGMTDQAAQEALAERWFKERGIKDLDGCASYVELYEFWPGFEFAFQKTVNGGTEVWLYADESANLDHLANIVQRFLKRFRPDDSFGLSWAGTCSKLRIGEFGGGALFITARRVTWMSTWDFIDDKRKKHEASQGRPKPRRKKATP